MVLNAESKMFTGATRLTNNTAEMSALIEVCWFLLAGTRTAPLIGHRNRGVTVEKADLVHESWIVENHEF